ncbi:MAG: hypothetical protein Q7J35_09675 [Candidatus Methanoperedens sp.]|jgi:hypothetical protein|nr:hypothetical protein [Candidatus Methanoperedens sp.]
MGYVKWIVILIVTGIATTIIADKVYYALPMPNITQYKDRPTSS